MKSFGIDSLRKFPKMFLKGILEGTLKDFLKEILNQFPKENLKEILDGIRKETHPGRPYS